MRNMSSQENYVLQKNVIIRGKIVVKTGIHIGSDKEKLSIGGVDSPVIKDPLTNKPIIPGSSLKGKMRSLMEHKLGNYKPITGMPHASPGHKCEDNTCPICVIFGSVTNYSTNLTRLIVRDSIAISQNSSKTEIKVENSIDRIKGNAASGALRSTERVPAGTEFDLELVYTIYDQNNDENLLKGVFESLALVEDSYLGGSGSRGYGKVNFSFDNIVIKTASDYSNKPLGTDLLEDFKNKPVSVSDILNSYNIIFKS